MPQTHGTGLELMRTLDRCPVCGSDRLERAYTGKTTRPIDDRLWSVDRCLSCSLGFMNPQPSWGQLQPYYSSAYPAYDPSHGAEAPDEQIIAEARQAGEYRHVRITEGLRLLEVGCGGGMFMRIARGLGAEVEGVEPSDVGADRARGQGLNVFNGTVEQYINQHADRTFDLITANHVLEHTPDPVATLSAMKQLLAPDGLIWVAVPNAGCRFCVLLRDRWHSTDLPFHLMQFTQRALTVAAEKTGLAVEEIATDSMPSAVASSIRLMLRYRFFIPRRLSGAVGWIDRQWAPRLSQRLDAERRGEALLARFRLPTVPI